MTQEQLVGTGRRPASVVVMIGGVLAAVGAFLPWITVATPLGGEISRSGVDAGGDGWIAVGIGLVAALSGLFDPRTGTVRVLWFLIGAGAVALGVADLVDVKERIASIEEDYRHMVRVGYGLYGVIAGGVLIALGSLVDSR